MWITIPKLNSALENTTAAIQEIWMNMDDFTDANLLPISSYTYVFTSAKNIPNVNNGSIIFTGGISNRKFQLCFGNNNKLYTRSINIAGNAWTDWVER